MSIDFARPNQRGGGNQSNLAVSISPFGLVELADEEFEVHGPRLNRYATSWAFYLGHHWSYQREAGEPQVTFNYVKAFTDYLINFCFGKGVHFQSPQETGAIVPSLLKRVWEQDNVKDAILYEIGQQGGVTGDVFIKVAYEEPYQDPAGGFHPGRVRILPLNASHCFPEWHPHDKDRMLRFKLKYRFWGTSMEGTRQVFTYTEILTDTVIEEYVNDELIDQRPNPLGMIPVVHIANKMVSSSPWGIGDCESIQPLNRLYNEINTDIVDIINYHAAPVTVVTGAKINQLEKGPKKVWGGLPKDAQVFNLELGANLAGPMAYLEQLKRAMHEMTGVPETALGQMQPISNTSGVALSIQFQPLMNVWLQKITQYSNGLVRVNDLVLRTLALKEPLSFEYDASTEGRLEEGQLPVLDPSDPITYITTCHWPPPLPVDKLVVLNEAQAMLGLNLESRKGVLRRLGEQFPGDKLEEIRAELMDDAKADGALNLLSTQIQAAILELTGMLPGNPEDPAQLPPTESGPGTGEAGGGDGGPPGPQMPQPKVPPPSPAELFVAGEQAELQNDLATRAYGTKIPQRRVPSQNNG